MPVVFGLAPETIRERREISRDGWNEILTLFMLRMYSMHESGVLSEHDLLITISDFFE